MSGKNNKVPNLRFPEFRGVGEWDKKRLGEVCDVLNNRRQPITGSDRVKGSYPYYGASGIVDYVNEYIFDERLLLVGEDGAKWGAFENTAFVVEGKYWVNNHAHVLRSKEVIDTLLENYLSMIDIGPFITGAAPPKLTLGMLKIIPVPVSPDEKEQQKIAACLSSLDDLISAQTQKLAHLKTHKKGLMQQLFPAEGETQPKLRFPEFRDAGEWNVFTIEEIGDISSGGTPSRKNHEYWNGDIPWVSTTLIGSNTIKTVNEYITKTGLQNSSAKVFPKTTILMAMYGQGKTRGKVAMLGINAAINQACAAITLKESVNTDFVFQNLNARYEEIRKISNQGGQENLSGAIIKKILIPIPPKKSEQQKIADCLSSLDELITAQGQKLAQLKTHKKGLMQQLFPAADEVNG